MSSALSQPRLGGPGGSRLLRQAGTVLRRDLAVEVATREALGAVPALVLAGLLLVGLGFDLDSVQLARIAPGVVWFLVLTATVPLAHGVLHAERDDDAWDVLRALTDPTALLAGKAASLSLQLFLTWGLGALLAVGLLGAHWSVAAVVAAALGVPGVAVNTTVFGALLGDHRRPALLSTLTLTTGLPALLAGSQVAGSGRLWPWALLLVVYDVVAGTTAWAVFPALLEE